MMLSQNFAVEKFRDPVNFDYNALLQTNLIPTMSPIAVTPAPAVAAPLYHETLGGGTFKVKVRFSPDRVLLSCS